MTKTERKIITENIYNMDETGFAIGTLESNRIIIDSTLRTKFQAQPGRQEWVSILECICADATSIAPLVIFSKDRTFCRTGSLHIYEMIGISQRIRRAGQAIYTVWNG